MSLPEDLREYAAARATGVQRLGRPEHPDVILAREACRAAGLPSPTAAGSASLVEAIVEALRPQHGTEAADAALDALLADPARAIAAHTPQPATQRHRQRRATARLVGAVEAVRAAYAATAPRH